jgi:hypothetical protein
MHYLGLLIFSGEKSIWEVLSEVIARFLTTSLEKVNCSDQGKWDASSRFKFIFLVLFPGSDVQGKTQSLYHFLGISRTMSQISLGDGRGIYWGIKTYRCYITTP